MSTILKALRRLEQEKASSTSRPLREEVATPPFASGPAPRRGLPVVGIVSVLAVLLAFGAWWLLPRNGADAPTVATGVAEPEQIARAESPPPTSAPAPSSARADTVAPTAAAPSGPPDQAFSSPVEVVSRPPVTPRVPIDMSLREQLPATQPAEHPPVGVAARPSTGPSPQAGAPLEKARPLPRPVARAKPVPHRAAPPKVAASPAPVTRAGETRPAATAATAAAKKPEPQPAPAAVKSASVAPKPAVAEAPRIRVEKTLWHPLRERREADVGVDGAASRRVHEGDVVGRFVVSEIQPSGVVFEGDGTTIRRAIGAE